MALASDDGTVATDERILVAISSEFPVERYDLWEGERYLEVLDHSPESVDLSRVQDGMPFLFEHSRGALGGPPQVGLIEGLTVGADRTLRGFVRFGAHPAVDWIRKDIGSGIRKKVSVGYLADRNNVERTQRRTDALPTVRVKRWWPVECSTVAIPADPTVGVGRSVDDDASSIAKAVRRAHEVVLRVAAKAGEPTTTPSAPETAGKERTVETQDGADSPAPTIDRVADRVAEQERVEHIELLCERHADLCEGQGGWERRALQFIREGARVQTVRETFLREQRATLQPIATPERAPTYVRVEEAKPEKGIRAARMIRALAAGRGDTRRAAQWAEKHVQDAELVRALAASDGAAGGFVVPPSYSAEIIELLRPMSAVMRLNPTIIPMPVGTLSIPKLTGGAAASYVGENKNIGKTKPTFGMLKLTYKKLAALVPISNDLIRYSSPQADTVVRDDLGAAIAQRSDVAFIRDDGTQDTPKGLRHWAPAANVIAANATVNLANVTTDLGKLVLQLKAGEVRMLRPGWLFAPRTEVFLMTVRDGNGNYAFRDELLAGRLWGWPYATTTQIPVNLGGGTNESEVYLADFVDVVIGEGTNLILDSSGEAAYHDGAQLQAAFSLDQTVVRAIVEHDLGMRHDASVAVLTGVTWTP